MMDFRNPIYTADGRIDCEIDHPVYGWIPFTASPDDPNAEGAEIFAEIEAAGNIADYVPGTPAEPDWSALISAEGDRRRVASFVFLGKLFGFDDVSKSRITGAGALAGFAMMQGAGFGDPYWHGEETPFVWIADDNSLVEMDAPTCFAFAQAAARHESLYVFTARAIKDIDPLPPDITDDALWPVMP